MTRWEYCEAVWQPGEVVLTTTDPDDGPTTEGYPAADWPAVLSRLGADGWEMVSCTGSPMGVHEYYFYFKRAVEE